MQTSTPSESPSPPGHPPVSPAELRALKRSAWLVVGLCLAFFTCVFVWDNSHRVLVNALELPLIGLAVFVGARAARRLWKALPESERGFRRKTKSE